MKQRALVIVLLGLAALCLAATPTVINLATQVAGILPCADHAALTGNVTAPAGSCATTVAVVPITLGGLGSSALTPGSAVAMNFSLGAVFTLTPAQTETISASGCTAGQKATLIVTTSGTTSFTLTFSTNFRTTGTLATGTTTAKEFAISFVCNGATATETSRTVAE